MKDHGDIRKLLPAYCSGDLEPAERIQVEEHLKSCPACSTALADLEITLRLIRTTPQVEPPPWLTSRIMARLQDEKAAKRSWLQRLFFPLHVKLPLEFVALFMVCVSGYYLARNVETEMQNPVPQIQEAPAPAPAPAPETQRRTQNAPERSVTPPQSTKSNVEKKAAQAPERKAAPEPSPTPQPAVKPPAPAEPAAPRSPSTYAPAPPAATSESSKSLGFDDDVQSESPQAKSYDRAENAGPVMKKKVAKRLKKQESESSRTAQLPRLRLRLSIADPATGGDTIRQVLNRSGGTLVEGEQPSSGRHLKARIPTARFTELVEHLERLGTIAEQPAPPDSAGLVEVDIVW